jgi:DNA-binding response OmpR family regulator
LKVLFVDGDIEYAQVFGENLRRRGFSVVIATSILYAEQLLVEQKFDVMITSASIPTSFDGYQGAELANFAASHSVPTIILTSSEEKMDRLRENAQKATVMLRPDDWSLFAMYVRQLRLFH